MVNDGPMNVKFTLMLNHGIISVTRLDKSKVGRSGSHGAGLHMESSHR